MSGILNNVAESSYRRFLDHLADCRRCANWNATGATSMCPPGRRLLQLWEHAESNALAVA